MAQLVIKVPSVMLFNTVLISKKLPAFILEGKDCQASFGITSDGSMYSSGGCLG
jgi:hypothetical protein